MVRVKLFRHADIDEAEIIEIVPNFTIEIERLTECRT